MINVNDILNIDEVASSQYKFQRNLPINIDIDTVIYNDMEIYNEVDKVIAEDELNTRAVNELAAFRVFKPDFLLKKHIVCADGLGLLQRQKIFKYSSLAMTDNNFLTNKYLLPIRLPNGLVFTYMSYDPNADINRYTMPSVKNNLRYSYAHQGSMLGNLESLNIGGNEIYCAEGFFDAYRLEESMGVPGIALLGSNLTKTKYRILREIKKKTGKRLIYVPDIDANKAGTGNKLIGSDIWDNIFNFNLEFNTDKVYKDIDQYFREQAEKSGDWK